MTEEDEDVPFAELLPGEVPPQPLNKNRVMMQKVSQKEALLVIGMDLSS